jgi:large subunit ribosomal protein L31e
MAETKNKEIKRTYNIPLRSGFLKKTKHTRAKVCMRIIKEFLIKHMKSEDIKLGPRLNEDIWKHGMKNPPHHIKVDVIKKEDGEVNAELFGFEYVSNKVEEKKESIKDRIMSKVGGQQKSVVKKVKDDKEQAKDVAESSKVSDSKKEVTEKIATTDSIKPKNESTETTDKETATEEAKTKDVAESSNVNDSKKEVTAKTTTTASAKPKKETTETTEKVEKESSEPKPETKPDSKS